MYNNYFFSYLRYLLNWTDSFYFKISKCIPLLSIKLVLDNSIPVCYKQVESQDYFWSWVWLVINSRVVIRQIMGLCCLLWLEAIQQRQGWSIWVFIPILPAVWESSRSPIKSALHPNISQLLIFWGRTKVTRGHRQKVSKWAVCWSGDLQRPVVCKWLGIFKGLVILASATRLIFPC